MRELRREDVSVINRWRRDRELVACLGAPYRYIGPEVDLAWFDGYLASRGSAVRCVTVEEDSPEVPLCLTTLSGIDWVNGSCELHIMVGEESNRGRGVGTFSVFEMVRHAFEDLNLRRVELSVLDANARARGLYEKAGFEYEGLKRQARYKQGEYVDLRMMALLKEDWLRMAGGRG